VNCSAGTAEPLIECRVSTRQTSGPEASYEIAGVTSLIQEAVGIGPCTIN
jgi:hypothetical protein